MSQERSALDARAICVMLLLTALWGFQQVTIKLIAADVSLVMQAAIRSIAATLLLFLWARLTRQVLFQRDGTLAAGVAAGLLFAFEFVFIYAGLGHTNASRMSVFVYSRRRSPRSVCTSSSPASDSGRCSGPVCWFRSPDWSSHFPKASLQE